MDELSVTENARDIALERLREMTAVREETARLLGYLWNATGVRSDQLHVRDLFAPEDPLVADVERLAIMPEWVVEPSRG